MSECNLHCTLVFQYIHPTDAHKLGQAELLVIDEAAAIPLPYVKSMLGPYLVFLASTINGLVNSVGTEDIIILHMIACE
jgi:tRNA(Met) C34 N-acetyltransferase TmcA